MYEKDDGCDHCKGLVTYVKTESTKLSLFKTDNLIIQYNDECKTIEVKYCPMCGRSLV